ncbi:MAG: VWA domain-containing protein, partial [Kiritimatiellaeota bacterium]|nr:VWA domain-containing protein [Kiritimatiellota bacterium]
MDFFEYPLRLLHMLWLAPLFGLLVYWSTAKRKNVLQALFGSEADVNKTTTLSLGRRYARLWLLFAAALLLCVACARPRWGWRILPFSGRGRDLMVLIDVSKSMLSEDVRPSRLKHAKQFVRELIASTPGNRYGLVDFAGTAFLECPMTVDKTSLFQALDDLNVDSIPVGGTNIENALKKATLAFKAAEGGYKAIILITDGDELYGDSSQVVSELKKREIPLFVVGIGDPDGDGLIKMSDARGKTKLMRDSMGKLVKSRLNEKGLKRLAEKTGGIYVRSTETNLGLAPIRERIKKLVPKEYSKGNCKRPIERFHYPLLAAVILLLIRLSIGERGRRRCLSVLLFVSACLFSTFSTFSADAGTATTSTVPPSAGLPIAAQADSGKKLSEQPITGKAGKTTPVALYNRALELHNKRKFKEAAKLYRRAVNMSKVSEEVRSKAFQNLGVISHQKGEALLRKDSDAALRIFDKAEEMYKESMRSDIRRKRVVLNQQRLLDDRRLAKLIKKRREEMRKKRERAREKTRKALNQQKKENQRKNKQQKNKQKKKQQSQQQKQRRNRNERQKKKDGQKQNAGKSDENREKQERKNDAASNSNS